MGGKGKHQGARPLLHFVLTGQLFDSGRSVVIY